MQNRHQADLDLLPQMLPPTAFLPSPDTLSACVDALCAVVTASAESAPALVPFSTFSESAGTVPSVSLLLLSALSTQAMRALNYLVKCGEGTAWFVKGSGRVGALVAASGAADHTAQTITLEDHAQLIVRVGVLGCPQLAVLCVCVVVSGQGGL